MKAPYFRSSWIKAGILLAGMLLGLWGIRGLQHSSVTELALNPEQQDLKEFEQICAAYIQDMLEITPSKTHTLSVIQTGKLSTGYTLEAYINTGSQKRWFACENNSDANRIVTTIRNE